MIFDHSSTLTSVIEIQKKKIGGNHAASLSLKNAWLPPIFSLDSKITCLVRPSLHSFKPSKNISVSTTHRKSEYLEMCIMCMTYAQ